LARNENSNPKKQKFHAKHALSVSKGREGAKGSQRKTFAFSLRPFGVAQDMLCDFACAFNFLFFGSGLSGLGKSNI